MNRVKTKERNKQKLVKDLIMFISFLFISVFVYIFHIVQSEARIRGYVTATSLLVSYMCSKQKVDTRIGLAWMCFFSWVVSSNVYYDPRTYVSGIFRLLKHILFAICPVLAITQQFDKILSKVWFWLLVVIAPDISSNVYGNALFSIIRVFLLALLILVRIQTTTDYKNTNIEDFAWVLYCHEILLFFVMIQLVIDVLPITLTPRYPFYVRNVDKEHQQSDVIGMNDVPFITEHGIMHGQKNGNIRVGVPLHNTSV